MRSYERLKQGANVLLRRPVWRAISRNLGKAPDVLP